MKNQHPFKSKNAELAFAISLALGISVAPELAQAAPVKPSCPTSTKWSYLGAYSPSTGKPNGMTDSSALIPGDLISRTLKLLPEGKNIISNPVTKALIATDAGANLYIAKTTSIKVAFVTEGAGYSNALAFFKYDATNYSTPCILNERIILPNSSAPPLSFGNTVDLGYFNKGDVIGFTVIANGWDATAKVVKPTKPDTGIFRSVMGLNPETNGNNAHTVLLSSPEDKLLILGFEDLNRQSNKFNDSSYTTDNDFNDVIIAIIPTYYDDIDTTKVPDVDTGVVTPTPTPTPTPIPTPTPEPTPEPTPTPGVTKPLGMEGRMSWREKVDTKTTDQNQGNNQESVPQH